MTWQPLTRSTPHRNGVPIDIGDEEQWANDQYVVYLRRATKADDEDPDAPAPIHLSIKNQDRSTRHDWRDFQRIKNQLCGPEWEAIELYPAESRLVDMANQYHLFCFPFHVGLGFPKRLVANQAQADIVSPGARQRDPEAVDLQYGGLSRIKDMQAGIDQFYGKEED
jgi:hypothetical protein